MRIYSHRLLYALLILSALLSGCKKEQKPSVSGAMTADNLSVHSGGILRLVSSNSDFGLDEFEYNSDGLLLNWHFSGTTFTYEYDQKGRITKTLYYEGAVQSASFLIYYNDKGQLIRFEQYEGNTNEKIDEVFVTYDNQGNGIRQESFMQDYYTINKYDNQGLLLEWIFYFNDVIFYKSVVTYNNNLRNPFSAIPGLPFAFQYVNGFFTTSKFYSTSESISVYDENGDVAETYPQDPSRTIAEAGPNHFVGSSDFWDVASQSYIHFVFSYEKGRIENLNRVQPGNTKRISIQQFLRNSGKGTMKEKISAFRKSFGS